MLPPLDRDGNLPPGIHYLNGWEEFVTAYATNPHRQQLINGLTEALRNLKVAGCTTVYIDGSFVSSKTTPSDYDACWEPAHVDPQKLDPILLIFDDRRAAQKAKYGGELFPSSRIANRAGATFLEFFQKDKATGQPKGIVAVNLQTVKL